MNRATAAARVLGLSVVLTMGAAMPAVATHQERTSVSAAAPASARTGAHARVTGRVTPRARRPVLLQVRHGSRWSTTRRARTSRTGRYALTLPTTTAGRPVFRVLVPAARGRRAGASRAFPVAVRGAARRGRATSYSYLLGTKYRWNPCAPIGYRVNTRYAPATWASDVAGALRRVSAASGLRFANRGTTSVLPGAGDDTYPTDTGLVIAFAHVGQSTYTSAGAAGMGGALGTTVATAHGQVATLVRGFVVLDADVTAGLAGGFGLGHRYGYQGTRGQLLMHEVGHAVGLGHAEDDRLQIMFPSMSRKVAEWGRGDANGLRSVGARGGCIVPAAGGRRAPGPVRVGVLG